MGRKCILAYSKWVSDFTINYLKVLLIIIQFLAVILVSLIFQYTSRSNVTLTGLLTLLIAFNAVMLSGTINEYMPFLQMFSIISFSASKIPQVYWNFYVSQFHITFNYH